MTYTDLRDPGLFRWPPHANLLYPFFYLRPSSNVDDSDGIDRGGNHPNVDPDIIAGLVEACRQCEPFDIRLQRLGTFGGEMLGVLYFNPDSHFSRDGGTEVNDGTPPLVRLQTLLVESFPTCDDQSTKSTDGFHPHMTVSHFRNLVEAAAAQRRVEGWWPTNLDFPVDCAYLLRRSGDSGQFLLVADISLGTNAAALVHAAPKPFRHMPETEEDWVLKERINLKSRRNGRGGNRRETS